MESETNNPKQKSTYRKVSSKENHCHYYDSHSYFKLYLYKIICWISSHIGVRRNDKADWAAKSALDLTPTISEFHILTRKPKSINSFTRNGNNAGIIIYTINSFRSSPLWENGDEPSENQEENKSSYSDCILVIHGSLTLSYRNKNNSQCLTCQSPCAVKHILIE